MIVSRADQSAPRRVVEKPLHKFRIGEKVTWQAQPVAQARSRGIVTIVMLLPPLGNNLQYRIKNLRDPHEFVVLEHELSRDTTGGDLADTFS